MHRLLPLMYALSELQDALDERLAPLCEAEGISVSQFHMLYVVHEQGSLRQSELAKYRRCVKSNISYLLSGLERDRLVQRTRDPDDSRGKRISLSAEGQRRLLGVVARLERLEALLRRELGPSATRRLELTSLLAAQILDERADAESEVV